jgi:uncharacterized protein YqeY
MSLLEQIRKDMLTALKSGEKDKSQTLKMLWQQSKMHKLNQNKN